MKSEYKSLVIKDDTFEYKNISTQNTSYNWPAIVENKHNFKIVNFTY